MAFNSFLNNSIKILLVLLISIMLIIGTIFVLPPSFATDSDTIPNLSDYFYFVESNSAVMSGNVITVADSYNTLVFKEDVKHSFEFDFTFDFNSGGTSETSFPLMTWLYNTHGAWSNLVNCQAQGGYLKVSGSGFVSGSGHYSSVGTTASFLRVFSNGGATSTYTITNLVIDGESVGSVPLQSFNKTVAVEAGYVAYILCDGGYADFTTTFSVNSNLFNGGWLSNQRYGYSSSRYPDSGTTFTTSFGNAISWQKLGTADKNILGQTKSAYFTIASVDSSSSSPQYLVVYNPAYNAADDVNYEPNPTIYVHCSNLVGANKFKLLSSIGINDTVSAIDPDDYVNFHSTGTGSEIIGDGDSLYWYEAGQQGVTSTESAITYFPAGGYNDYDTDNSYESVLNGLVQKVVNLLSAPVDHIKNLINAGQEFMSNFSNLYSWLPEPVLTVLTSALALVVVIGVIKLLH